LFGCLLVVVLILSASTSVAGFISKRASFLSLSFCSSGSLRGLGFSLFPPLCWTFFCWFLHHRNRFVIQYTLSLEYVSDAICNLPLRLCRRVTHPFPSRFALYCFLRVLVRAR
jgi:hypothetical protein